MAVWSHHRIDEALTSDAARETAIPVLAEQLVSRRQRRGSRRSKPLEATAVAFSAHSQADYEGEPHGSNEEGDAEWRELRMEATFEAPGATLPQRVG